MRPADKAWIVVLFGVVVYEVLAALKRWELLSEAADRYRHHRPLSTHVVVLYLAGHLLRRWPSRIDPLHQIAERLGLLVSH